MPEHGYRVRVVGVGGTTPAARDVRGALGRPHWWGVLAVSLALMALVAALSAPSRRTSASDGGRFASRRPAASASLHRHSTRPGSVAPGAGKFDPTTTVPTSDPTAGPGAPIATVSAPGGLGATEPSGPSGAAPPAPVPLIAVPSTTTTTTTTTGPVTTTTTVPVTTDTDPGNLEYPDNVSAQYPVDSGGGVSVVADFSGAPALDLSVTCPGGHTDRDGASGVSVTVGGPAGTCTVEVSEPTPQAAPVSYTLTVQYPGG